MKLLAEGEVPCTQSLDQCGPSVTRFTQTQWGGTGATGPGRRVPGRQASKGKSGQKAPEPKAGLSHSLTTTGG